MNRALLKYLPSAFVTNISTTLGTTFLSNTVNDPKRHYLISFQKPCRPPQRPVLSMATQGEVKESHKAGMDDVKEGRFVRKASVFRHTISNDEDANFRPELDRYHLYVSLACPWASRVLAVRALKGLEDVFPVTVVHHHMGSKGWRFVTVDETDAPPSSEPEPLYGLSFIRDLYFKADPDYDGRFTVPVLWDKKLKTIVNNESSELIVMLNNLFNSFAKYPDVDLYPESLREEIDQMAESFYNSVNNGVYRCGFARSQEAYDEAVEELFEKLEQLEQHLSKRRYLVGDKLTIADIRLFVTLIRFDPVYVCHFKTNKKRLMDYPNLSAFTRELYQMPAIRSTVDFEHIKKHYFCSHPTINPFGIVPAGPSLSYLDEPHGRDSM